MKALIKIIVSMALAASVAACGGGGFSSAGALPTLPTTLQVIDTQIGTGPAAAAGDTLVVNYTGWLYDSTAANFEGTEFNSGTNFSFTLGAGAVIAGWDQGLVGMQASGTRTLLIPSALAYGIAGSPPQIPPNAGLVFTVQLVSITPAASSN